MQKSSTCIMQNGIYSKIVQTNKAVINHMPKNIIDLFLLLWVIKGFAISDPSYKNEQKLK